MVLDSLLGIFLAKLETLDIAQQVNVIVTSDHGMGSISEQRKVVLSDHFNRNWVKEILGYTPNFNIKAAEGYIDSIYHSLANVEGVHVWRTGELHERLHYGTHPRTLDLVVLADSSWSVVINNEETVGLGAHGFDNANPDMHTIFYAFGPAFRENYASPVFNNVDIYPLICEILGLGPAEVDGKLENVTQLLKNHETRVPDSTSSSPANR
jgi:alkaline phosphatase D